MFKGGVPGDSVRVTTAVKLGFEHPVILVVLVVLGFRLLAEDSWRVLTAELRQEEEDVFHYLVREDEPEEEVAEPCVVVVM